MSLILWGLAGFYLFVITWVLYLAVMNLRHNKEKLTTVAKFVAYPVAFVGVVVDAIFNITVGTVIFLEIPHEWLFTHRLERQIAEGASWRRRIAMWFCINLLDPFDPSGEHCDK